MKMLKIASVLAAVLGVFATGCAHSQSAPTSGGVIAPLGSLGPDVLQNQDHGGFVVLNTKTNSPTGTEYKSVVTGPDKNVWVLDQGNKALAKITMTGKATEFPLAPVSTSLLDSMAVGSDGKFYVPTGASPGVIEVMTVGGTAQALSIPSTDSALSGVTDGPDGNVWFPEYSHIAKLTPAGAFTEYPYPDGRSISTGGDITTGPDGNLWFAFVTFNGSFVGNVMKIVPATGAMTIYSLGSVGCQYDQGIVAGADANLWVECGAKLVRVDTGGNATAFPLNNASGLVLGDMARGVGNLIWYVGAQSGGQLSSFDVVTHAEVDRTPPLGANLAYHVTQGPDTNVWFTGLGSASQPTLGVYLLNVLKVSPKKVTFTATGQTQALTVTESGVTSWKASSSNTAVATVTPRSGSAFTVTAQGAGKATITIKDAVLNSYHVSVTVQ